MQSDGAMNTGSEQVRMCKDAVTAHEDNMTERI